MKTALFNEHVGFNSMSVLLEGGTDPSLADERGEIPLHVLTRSADLRTVKIFQSTELAGVNPDVKTNARLTAWNIMEQREGVTADLENASKEFDGQVGHAKRISGVLRCCGDSTFGIMKGLKESESMHITIVVAGFGLIMLHLGPIHKILLILIRNI